MIYAHAMQEAVIYHIAAANSLSVHPVLSIGLMSDLLDVEKNPRVGNSPFLTNKKCICVLLKQ